MKLIVNGRSDIRPLALEDYKASPLPYEGLGRLFSNPTGITSDSTKSITFTSINWGLGLDFYFTGFTFLFSPAGAYANKTGLYLVVREPTTGEMFYQNTFNQSRVIWTLVAANFAYSFNSFHLRKVLATQTVQFDITNLTIHTANLAISMQGIAIAPELI